MAENTYQGVVDPSSVWLERATNGYIVHYDTKYVPLHGGMYDCCQYKCYEEVFEITGLKKDDARMRAITRLDELMDGTEEKG